MKAVVKYDEGSKKVKLMDMEMPEPKKGQVRIKVSYAGICGSDIHIYLDDGGYNSVPPVVLGHEVSGVIDAVGEDVDDNLLGRNVVTETYAITCGHCNFCVSGRKNLCAGRKSIGSGVNGGMTEYVVVPQGNIHFVPQGLKMSSAAMTEPLACCAQAVFEKANITPGDTVLLTGPGAIGLMCQQLAQLRGGNVIVAGTQKDMPRLEIAKKLGATKVVTTDHDGAIEEIADLLGEYGADVVLECSGAAPAINMCLQLIRKGGCFVQVGLTGKPTTLDMNLITLKELEIIGTFAQKPIWWTRSLQLLGEKKIVLEDLYEEPVPLEDWEEAFQGTIRGEGMKRILSPQL